VIRTRYGVSPWIDEVSRKRRPDAPRFTGSGEVPVVIVGGGLTGCLTAYAFAASGIRTILLEAGRIGRSGGGRTSGVMRGEAAADYRGIERRHGRKKARALFEASRRAVLDLATTARRLSIHADVDTLDAVRVHTARGADEKAMVRETALRRDAGLDAVWLKAAAAARETGVDEARAAVRYHDWGAAQPYRLTLGFLRAAESRGAGIFERSEVRRIRVRRRDVEIHLDAGVLAAQTVIVCTGEPTALFRPLRRHFDLETSYVVLTDRLPAAMRKAIGARPGILTDAEIPPHVVRWTADEQLVVMGGDQPRPPARALEKAVVQRTGQLMYELSRLYPAISGLAPAFGWDLPLATTADGVMYAGPHRNYPRHLFAWGTRHDPAQAFLASRLLLRHYLEETVREDWYFSFTRG
jgi:glycine/D-amino acid oxidase-like deaminating enzyme